MEDRWEHMQVSITPDENRGFRVYFIEPIGVQGDAQGKIKKGASVRVTNNGKTEYTKPDYELPGIEIDKRDYIKRAVEMVKALRGTVA